MLSAPPTSGVGWGCFFILNLTYHTLFQQKKHKTDAVKPLPSGTGFYGAFQINALIASQVDHLFNAALYYYIESRFDYFEQQEENFNGSDKRRCGKNIPHHA